MTPSGTAPVQSRPALLASDSGRRRNRPLRNLPDAGFDVSVQYGPNKPKYDLVVAEEDLLTVSVMGSQDGFWDVTQPYLKRATELTGKKVGITSEPLNCGWTGHGSRAACCFVQFQGVAMDRLPRIYLASPRETAERLWEIAEGRGDSILYDEFAEAFPLMQREPLEIYRRAGDFPIAGLEELLAFQEGPPIPKPQIPEVDLSPKLWIAAPDKLPCERQSWP